METGPHEFIFLFEEQFDIYEYMEIKLVLDNKFSCSLCRMDGEERGNTIDHGINALCMYNGISKNSKMRFLDFERDFFFFLEKMEFKYLVG